MRENFTANVREKERGPHLGYAIHNRKEVKKNGSPHPMLQRKKGPMPRLHRQNDRQTARDAPFH